MSRVNHKAVLAQRNNAAALFLFDENDLPLKPEWVQAIRDKRYEHTGARLLDDEVKVQRMVDLLCLGNGVKKVAKAMGVSPHCVRAARKLLLEQGKLAPFKARFIDRAEELIEDGAAAVVEAIESGKMHPNFISSAVGIFFDKRALALGEPTSISVGASVKLAAEALSVKALNDWAADLSGEGESSGKAGNAKETKDVKVLAASFDAGLDVPKAVADRAGEAPAAAADDDEGDQGEGGGFAAAATGKCLMGGRARKF
jgi:hypothetical protein